MSTAHSRPRQAVILAGGRGSRMRPLTDHTPKHMLAFHGRPFAAAQVEMLAAQGFDRVLFLLGYLPEATMDHFGDGRRWGLEIQYDVTPADCETAYRMRHAFARLDRTFLLCYCDNLWPLRLLRQWQQWRQAGTLAQITVYDNTDAYTRSNVTLDQAGRVAFYDRTRTAAGLAGVDIGYALMDRSVVGLIDRADAPLEAVLYPRLAATGQLSAWLTGHRYYSVGSPERMAEAEAYLAGRRAVLLDRDGVLNRRPAPGEYVAGPEQFEWLAGARRALEQFAQAGYRVIVVTNQAGIGRGLVSRQQVDRIHQRMRAEAPIDAVYVCPHDFDAGCACRKPKPGMLYQAQRDFHLDLTRTWFLGDDRRDAEAAEAAGCLFAEVSERTPLIGFAESWLNRKENQCAY
jgi:D-glycero-D-manno-heptose 1,7-bisphosphate phosphatase